MIALTLRTVAVCALIAGSALADNGAALPAPAKSRHVILCGSGGEAEYGPKFREWGTRLRTVLTARFGATPDRVTLLMEPEPGNSAPDTASTLENIGAVFSGLITSVTAEDDMFVYLIGHGSHLKDESKFQIPGPDLTAAALDAMLAELPARRTIVINGTSASAGFINALSGPNRVIGAATKSAAEVNATEFMRFFIEALEDGSADRDRDERISVLEACEQAAALTASWYASETLIATEHSILDDNGDGLGTRLPIDPMLNEAPPGTPPVSAEQIDGALAAQVYLKDYSFPENAPKELITAYLAALDEVKALRARKGGMGESDYYAQLEALLLKAARANRDIRGYAGPPPKAPAPAQN